MNFPSNLKLADIEFYKPNFIDMLIGAEFFFDLIESGKIELGENHPVLMNTKLGWIVAGSIPLTNVTSLTCIQNTITSLNCLVKCDTLSKALERFWKIENVQIDATQTLTADEQKCEEFFERTTTRDDSGRFIVRLPFREDPNKLGASRDIALRRLNQLERRFKRDKSLQERYVRFMREYQELKHMSIVNNNSQEHQGIKVYLPHHCVFKESSTSTKIRTVFDASSKTDSGISLNDILHVGPTLQASLIDVLMRFRFHQVALIGDLRKMYRQINVHELDRDFQLILWRETPEQTVQEFRLNTVTYGEVSSSYLAIKCIRKLAEQAIDKYPIASRVVLDEMYVDDIMTGADNVKDAVELQQQLATLLQAGRFEIHKWCSNRPEVVAHLPQEQREDISTFNIDTNDTIKTLGLEWNPRDDVFQFFVKQTKPATTKRQLLSAISKFFDPLGLIGPIITSAKLFMQETWRLDYKWDEVLPPAFLEKWERFRRDLNSVEKLLTPRRVIACEKPKRVFLQEFCDASERAYGACLYVQAEDDQGILTSRLLCSKSRIAPIKTTSIPRLELCSALLLARLVASVRKSLRVQIDGLQAWSDSTVALCWIRGDAARWKQFVANRVIEITQLLPAEHWNHVRGEENPADLMSRGINPLHLESSELWWYGPKWLQEKRPDSQGELFLKPSNEAREVINAEERKPATICNVINKEQRIIQEILERFSSLTKIERILAYVLRFISNTSKKSINRSTGKISIAELQQSHQRMVIHIQAIHFSEEISDLQAGHNLKNTSKLIQLHPFLDNRGVLRVGGRLQHSSLTFERKHPIILPIGDRFTRLLFEREHQRLLHASQLLLLSSIKERYWPLRGRDLARQVCRACVWCAKNKPRELSQIMGPLPSDRVRPSQAFTITGVDFAGPITTLINKGRGRKTNKSYIALFVCFSTKAVHLEATSELTTAAFIATLCRFISRRGRPRILCSDNGTNFVGANREMKEVYQFLRTEVETGIGDMLVNKNVEWKFIPPNSPHMGGLWEAGVKSCKYHLKRIMGNALFTFEELSTALSQIEACLNSRPLSPMSADPMDLQPLTPAHFLIGESLTSLPDIDLTETPVNRLNRWQMIQRSLQDFWKRWASEYLNNLQGRSKWRTTKENLKINDLVILKEDNIPPLKWRLGRVTELHSGNDDLVRVATIRTSVGNVKRSIHKLCKLPISSESDEQISYTNLVGGMLGI